MEEELVFPLASAAEASQVGEMRGLLHEELAPLPSNHFPDVTGDLRLLRFLRGFDHSVPLAVGAVREMLAMRQRYGMDALHERWACVPCHHITGGFPHQESVLRFKPGLPTVGMSLHGYPIAYEPLRLQQYGRMLEEIGEQGMLDFYCAQCESRMHQLHSLSEKQGRMVKMILVIDLRAVSVWQLVSRRWAKYDETYQKCINRSLAEALAQVYIINSPSWAVSFYKRIKWWIPANTQRKIRLLGTDCEAELLQVMSPEVLHAMLHAFTPDGKLAAPPRAHVAAEVVSCR